VRAKIQWDLLHAKGLTNEEARVAAKAGLNDPEQMYWWTEAWQKGERVEGDTYVLLRVGTHDLLE